LLRRDTAQSIETVLPRTETRREKEHPMLDIVMLALGLGFFAAGIGYAYACERL
jgi:hypothetical protein